MKVIIISIFSAFVLISCSGNNSTIDEGFGYSMTKAQANSLIDSTIRAHVSSDRMLPAGDLVVSGYSRSLTDTQTYTISAIPVPAKSAYGLEVSHRGTMFNGPSKAKRIYKDVTRRAELLSKRVPLK